MTQTMAVFACTPSGCRPYEVARDTLIVVTALLANGRRVLVQVSSELLAPLLVVANTFRSATVVESPARALAPVCLLPLLSGYDAIPWLIRPLGEESSEETVSLLQILAATGAIDLRWLNYQGNLGSIFQEERPEAIVALGGTDEMAESMADAEHFAAAHATGLFIVGSRSERLSSHGSWRDLDRVAQIPKIKPLYRMDESYRDVEQEEAAAHHDAMHHASIAMAAEWLARHGEHARQGGL